MKRTVHADWLIDFNPTHGSSFAECPYCKHTFTQEWMHDYLQKREQPLYTILGKCPNCNADMHITVETENGTIAVHGDLEVEIRH